jgi:hypothetical protein
VASSLDHIGIYVDTGKLEAAPDEFLGEDACAHADVQNGLAGGSFEAKVHNAANVQKRQALRRPQRFGSAWIEMTVMSVMTWITHMHFPP